MKLQYGFENLGWYQFEKLIQSLLKAEIGMGIESWGGHKDYGIDAYFEGTLKYPAKDLETKGKFIFQVKFSEDIASKKRISRLKTAIKTWIKESLSKHKQGIDDTYYTILTNIPLTVQMRTNLKEEIRNLLKLAEEKIIIQDGNDICALLNNHREIRWEYPHLLGIQDVELVVNKNIIERSRSIIEIAHEIAPVFVPTKAYKRALETLKEHHFVVFEGPPEVGKTTTAYIIALNRIYDEWEAYDCRNPDDFFKIYKKSKKQIFVADDAFGSTEYRSDWSDAWARDMNKIMWKIDAKHWVIWTARTHIIKMALDKMYLQGKAENFPKPGEIIIDIGNFDFVEKSLILYNHAKQSHLESFGKKIIKKFWKEIIENPNFTPLRMKNFITRSIPNMLESNINELNDKQLLKIINDELKNPTRQMEQAFEYLPQEHKRLLFSMLDVEKPTYENLETSFKRHHKEGINPFKKILDELSSAFIKKDAEEIRWIHPSVRDLIINTLQKSPLEREEFIKNCDIEGIYLILSREESDLSTFLENENDWEVLTERFREISQNLNPAKLVKLLSILKGIKNKYLESPHKNSFLNLISVVLNSVKEFVEDKNKISQKSDRELPFFDMRVQMVKYYYELSLLKYPDLPIPNWKVLWGILLKEVEDIIQQNQRDISMGIYRLENLLNFSDICKEYDPRFLKIVEFPQSMHKLFLKYLEGIKNELKRSLMADEPDSLSSEAEYWEDIASFLENRINLFPEYEEQIEDMIQASEDKAEDYRSEAEESESSYNEEKDDYYDSSKTYTYTPSSISYLNEIKKMFDDL